MRRLTVALCAVLAFNGLVPAGVAHAENKCDPHKVGAYCNGSSDGTSYHGVVVVSGMRSSNGGGGGGGSSAACADCDWSLVPACWVNSPVNGDDALCGAAVQSCPGPEILFWVFLRRPDQPWSKVGDVCIGARNPVRTLDDLGTDAARYAKDLTPTASGIRAQGADPAVVNVPAFFQATGGGALSGTFGPPDARVTIDAGPTYVWQWGDGSPDTVTTSPGGPAPDGDVTHTYRAAGRRTVTLTTRWQATFTVATVVGTFGPFPVPGPPIALPTTQRVDVDEARGELIGGTR
jgi:hypothetical protein